MGLLMKIANEKDNNKSVRSGLISTPVRFLDTQGDTSMSTAILAVHFFLLQMIFNFRFPFYKREKPTRKPNLLKEV